VGTVSATLNGTARVSEKLARRVRLAVSRVGYSPDGVAQSLRLGRTRTIGLVVSDVCNPFFASLSRSVEAAAESAGYALILCNADEDPERELRLLSVLQMQRWRASFSRRRESTSATASVSSGWRGRRPRRQSWWTERCRASRSTP
jgi:DNA-binding LacI/PurR family transcriptional regulator